MDKHNVSEHCIDDIFKFTIDTKTQDRLVLIKLSGIYYYITLKVS